MHIALLTNGIYPFTIGGMQKHSYYLAKYIAKKKIKVDIFHYIPYNKKEIKEVNISDYYTKNELEYLTFYKIEFPKTLRIPGHYIIDNYLYSKNVYQKYRDLETNYFLTYIQGFSGWYLLKNTSNTLINFHGLEMFQKPPDVKSWFHNIIFKSFVKLNVKKANIAISLGGKLTKILKNIHNNVIEIPIGIDKSWLVDKPSEINTGMTTFVFVGRFERRKGVQELNRVLKSLEKTLNYQFYFIGPIPKEYQLNDSRITYHGLIKDEEIIKNILKYSDILVCPSWSEGMPTVILEAMASGCSIIATDVGAVSSLVDNNNGWLIPPGDYTALYTSMKDAVLLPYHELLEKKINSITKIKEKFLWSEVINLTLEKLGIKCYEV